MSSFDDALTLCTKNENLDFARYMIDTAIADQKASIRARIEDEEDDERDLVERNERVRKEIKDYRELIAQEKLEN